MTDIYLPELMELDSYWEDAVRDTAESTVRNRKRLEHALHNRKKINKILEKCGYKLANGRKRNENEGDSTDEDDDDAFIVDSYDTNLRPESVDEMESIQKARSGPSEMRKGKLTPVKRNYLQENKRTRFGGKARKRIEKLRPESVRDSVDEDGEESCSSSDYSKINPYILRKKRLAVITAEIKRRKRNTNTRRHEKRAKNLRVKGKTCKTKRPRKKIGRDTYNNNKQEQKSKNQETKVDSSNANESNGNANNEDIKKSPVAGKEVPVMKKVSQDGSKHASNPTGPPKPDKDHSKGDCSQDQKPKDHDISKCGDVCTKMAMDDGMTRGPPRLYSFKRLNRNCLRSRRMKCKQKRRGKKKTGPFIKFYLTVFKELQGICSVRSIAKEAGERWRCMSSKEKLKFYPRKYK